MAKNNRKVTLKLNKLKNDEYVWKLNQLKTFLASSGECADMRAKTLAKRHAKSAKAHFLRDGWQLDLDFLVTDFLYDLLGYHPRDMFLAELGKTMKQQDMEIVYTLKHDVIRFAKPKKAKQNEKTSNRKPSPKSKKA